VKALRSLLIASLLTVATSASAQDPNPWKFEFHGFVVGSLFMQDQAFLSGQGSGILNAAPVPANHVPRPGVSTDKSGTFVGGDFRQTRPIFVISGPEAFGAKPKAHFEFDLFGNTNAGGNGYQSPNVRMRQAYGELKWGNTTFDAGQHSAHLLLALIPTSVAHITNPVTLVGGGLIGNRSLGFRVFHTLPMDAWKLELGAEISQGHWNDALSGTGCGLSANTSPSEPGCAFPQNSPTGLSLAWASSMPEVVVRAKADGKSGNFAWMGWLAGYYESVNLKGFGNTNAPAGVTLQGGGVKKAIDAYAVTAGGKFDFMPVTLVVQAHTGRGTAPILGSMGQYGDIGELGYWAQLGFYATPQISLWALYAGSALDKKDLQKWANPTGAVLTESGATATSLRKDNQIISGMLRFMDGGYAVALEYTTITTKYLLGNLATDNGTKSSSGYQVVLSGGYFF